MKEGTEAKEKNGENKESEHDKNEANENEKNDSHENEKKETNWKIEKFWTNENEKIWTNEKKEKIGTNEKNESIATNEKNEGNKYLPTIESEEGNQGSREDKEKMESKEKNEENKEYSDSFESIEEDEQKEREEGEFVLEEHEELGKMESNEESCCCISKLLSEMERKEQSFKSKIDEHGKEIGQWVQRSKEGKPESVSEEKRKARYKKPKTIDIFGEKAKTPSSSNIMKLGSEPKLIQSQTGAKKSEVIMNRIEALLNKMEPHPEGEEKIKEQEERKEFKEADFEACEEEEWNKKEGEGEGN